MVLNLVFEDSPMRDLRRTSARSMDGITQTNCCNCQCDGEGTDGYKGRNNFAKYACKQCQKRREQWGGATTQAKFDAQKKQAEQAA